MSHLVALTAPQSAAHTVKRYAGFGIIGADIPASGDNGGSPVINDGVLAGSEYHWRVVTPPGSGTLTIYPDLSFDLAGAADGDWPWQYRLYEDGTDEGVATVSIHVGTHNVTVAHSQQINTASAASIAQTAPGILLIAHSQQINQASAASVLQTHLIGVPNSQQINTAIAAAISTGGFTGSLSDADIARIVAALPSASDIAAAVWQRAIENGHTSEQMIRIMFAALAGTSEQAGSTIVFKSADGATSRIIGSFDAANNRVGVMLDGH